MSLLLFFLIIIVFANLLDDAEREQQEHLAEMDAFFDKMHAYLETHQP